MTLLLDAGNSRLKWAILRHGIITAQAALAWDAIDDLADIWATLPEVTSVLLCSVAPAATTLRVIQCSRQRWSCPLEQIHSTAHRAGVSNAYSRPEALGTDRWVTLIGAHHHFPGNQCVVDLGTAATVDLLNADGAHQGGIIAPGYRAMTQSLHAATGLAIPSPATAAGSASAPPAPQMAPQADTAAAIRSGALHALVGLIDTSHRGFHAGSAQLLLTGGDAERVRPHLAAPVTHAPDLLFQGLAVLAES